MNFPSLVDGQEIAGIKNMWVPYTVTGTVKLAANQQVKVTLRGGGKDAKVFAGRTGSATDVPLRGRRRDRLHLFLRAGAG